jgi:hypothetical protein
VAVGIGILYAVSVYRNRNPERFSSAYRVALTIVLVYLLWALIPNVRAYADLVIRPTRGSRATMAKQRKLSQADLEAALIRVQQVAPNAGLRCTRADRDWGLRLQLHADPVAVEDTTRVWRDRR